MIFSLIQEQLQLLAYIVLIIGIKQARSCQGFSSKSFQIILIAYMARYWDIFIYDHTFYNITMKILYILSVIYIIYLMKYKYPKIESIRQSICDDAQKESIIFMYPYILAGFFTLIMNTNFFYIFELSWSYSRWLEAISILPQIQYLKQTQFTGNIDGFYISIICMQRLFCHISRFHFYYEYDYICYTSVLAGVLQTILLGFLIKQYYHNKLKWQISV